MSTANGAVLKFTFKICSLSMHNNAFFYCKNIHNFVIQCTSIRGFSFLEVKVFLDYVKVQVILFVFLNKRYKI